MQDRQIGNNNRNEFLTNSPFAARNYAFRAGLVEGSYISLTLLLRQTRQVDIAAGHLTVRIITPQIIATTMTKMTPQNRAVKETFFFRPIFTAQRS